MKQKKSNFERYLDKQLEDPVLQGFSTRQCE